MAAVDVLTKADIEQRPASVIVGIVCNTQRELTTEESLISTKFALESEMIRLKADLRVEMAELKADLRMEMAELKADLRVEMAELKTELKSDMKNLEVSVEKQFARLYRYLLIGAGVYITLLAGILYLLRGSGF